MLRELRRGAGLTGEDLAARCATSQSKISRIETGKLLPSVTEVDRILKALNVPPDKASKLLELARAANVDYTSGRVIARMGLDHQQREVKAQIESATVFRHFLPAMPPGFLQLRQYAEAVMTPVVPSAPRRDVNKAVRARIEMRSVLDDESRRFVLVMTEQAVRWNYAGAEIMAQQVAHMARESRRPNVDLAVLSNATETPKAPVSIFKILYERLVLVEMFNGNVSFRDPRDVTYYLELFEFFYDRALKGDDAIDFLEKVAEEFRDRSHVLGDQAR
ncbi:helix-turn-helix protein [Herbihabitans rhizosphaerae]|uniref:Helix-turn-helix protein n=1 Tax=Herbihabitans rhizosphaerae TaxID=1872711 RepID=A0A4Q7KJE7_9PSEU|nr:helix-turn-helix protein [Herbihabitans rhizosphaerae]